MYIYIYICTYIIQLCSTDRHVAQRRSTPDSHHKIQVFSDPTLGTKYCGENYLSKKGFCQNTSQKKVSVKLPVKIPVKKYVQVKLPVKRRFLDTPALGQI